MAQAPTRWLIFVALPIKAQIQLHLSLTFELYMFELTSPNCKHKVCARISQAQMQRKFSCIWACEFQLEFCWVAIHAQMQLQLRWTFGIRTRDVKTRLNSHSSNAAEIHWIWACAFQPANLKFASSNFFLFVKQHFVELHSSPKCGCISAAFEPASFRSIFFELQSRLKCSSISAAFEPANFSLNVSVRCFCNICMLMHICFALLAYRHEESNTRLNSGSNSLAHIWHNFSCINFEPASFSCEFCRVANPGSYSVAFELTFELHVWACEL